MPYFRSCIEISGSQKRIQERHSRLVHFLDHSNIEDILETPTLARMPQRKTVHKVVDSRLKSILVYCPTRIMLSQIQL